jgi:putative ABC transport system permease protein
LILIAFVISIPVAIYFVTIWLENFAYQIEVQWWIYLQPQILVLFISLLLVNGQTIKAARQIPVDYLRYEKQKRKILLLLLQFDNGMIANNLLIYYL